MKLISKSSLKLFSIEVHTFISIWITASFTDLYYWCKFGDPIMGIHLSIIGFIISYISVFPLTFLKNIVYRSYKIVIFSLGCLNIIIDSLCYNIYHSNFVMDIVAICAGSNIDESMSFLGMYLNGKILAYIVFVIFLMIATYIVIKRYKCLSGNYIQAMLHLLFVICSLKNMISPSEHFSGVFLNKIYLLCSYSTPKDLKEFRTEPIVKITGEQPDKILLIIGESLSKSHCSYYGYQKKTMPKIDSLIQNNEVIPFTNITAAHYTTVESIEKIMTTFSSINNSKEWYKYIYLQDLMKAGGYKNYWISNQSSAGFADNVVCKIAQLSDSVVWVGQSLSGAFKKDYDELLLPVFNDIKNIKEKQFIVVHMMGQHENFEDRYPKNRTRFTPDNINDWRSHWVSHYDNAVSYTDSVVYSMISKLKKDNAIAIFFPDHGLDIFKTNKDYAGHARPSVRGSLEECLAIPLFIYATPSYKRSHEKEMKELIQNTAITYNTENIIYTICDFAKIHFQQKENGPSLLQIKQSL